MKMQDQPGDSIPRVALCVVERDPAELLRAGFPQQVQLGAGHHAPLRLIQDIGQVWPYHCRQRFALPGSALRVRGSPQRA